MRADWTASGACPSGSTAPPAGATRPPASGGAVATSTTRAEPNPGYREPAHWRSAVRSRYYVLQIIAEYGMFIPCRFYQNPLKIGPGPLPPRTRPQTAGNSRKTATTSLLFWALIARKRRISAENAMSLAVNLRPKQQKQREVHSSIAVIATQRLSPEFAS